MVLVGLVLVLAVVVIAFAVVNAGGDPVRLHLHWFTIGTDGTVLFVAGAASLLVLVLGFWALRVGVRRARSRRREMKELRQRALHAPSSTVSRPPRTAAPARPPPRRSPDADDFFDTTPRD